MDFWAGLLGNFLYSSPEEHADLHTLLVQGSRPTVTLGAPPAYVAGHRGLTSEAAYLQSWPRASSPSNDPEETRNIPALLAVPTSPSHPTSIPLGSHLLQEVFHN